MSDFFGWGHHKKVDTVVKAGTPPILSTAQKTILREKIEQMLEEPFHHISTELQGGSKLEVISETLTITVFPGRVEYNIRRNMLLNGKPVLPTPLVPQ